LFTFGDMRRRLLIALAALLAAPSLAAASEGKDGKKKTGGDSYVPLDTLTAYMPKPNGRRGVMTVDVGLDIPDGRLRDRAELLLPRLRASFVQSVQIYAGGLPYGTAPDPQFLGRTLQRSTDQILGRPGARVLLGAVIVN
jgi:hypothetical protein